MRNLTLTLALMGLVSLTACGPETEIIDSIGPDGVAETETEDTDGNSEDTESDDTGSTWDTGVYEDDTGTWDSGDDTVYEDLDQDGYTGDVDCNDSPLDENADGIIDGYFINPGMDETCNGVDDNCDGQIDEDLELTESWLDQDADGYGAGEAVETCEGAPGYASIDGDCNDTDDSIHPGAEDVGGDGIDSDCDDETEPADESTGESQDDDEGEDESGDEDTGDAGDDETEEETPTDADADGYSDESDCDDSDDSVNPGATEVCDDGIDQDCDGEDLECEAETDPNDVDDDGDGQTENEGDCDDTDAAISELADEICGDGIDNDCSGDADGSDAIDAIEWFTDADADGFGDTSEGYSCEAPTSDSVEEDGDCDDSDADINPDAVEYDAGIDAVDNDCDGETDEDWQATVAATYGSSVSGTLNTALYSDGASPNANSWNHESVTVSGTEAEVEYLSDDYDVSGTCGLIINGDSSALDYLCYGGAQDTDVTFEIMFDGVSYDETDLTVWIADATNDECALILQVDSDSSCDPVDDVIEE